MGNEKQRHVLLVQSSHWPKILLFIAFGLVTITGSVIVGIQIGKNQKPIQQSKTIVSPSTIPISSSLNAAKDQNNWNIYNNDKFGFSLKYPSDLNLKPQEIDIKSIYSDYINKCKTGVIDGCGGSRWPDFKISFLRPNSKIAFDISIYQLPIFSGGIERDKFTYFIQASQYSEQGIKTEPVNKETLKNIQKTLQFYKPSMPLACLWEHTDLGPGFDPFQDKNYINKNKKALTLVEGYAFNSNSNLCTKEAFFTWTEQIESDKPPFRTKEDCLSSCLK